MTNIFRRKNREEVKEEVKLPIEFIPKQLPTDCEILELKCFVDFIYFQYCIVKSNDPSFPYRLEEYLKGLPLIYINAVKRNSDGLIIREGDPFKIIQTGWVGLTPYYEPKWEIGSFSLNGIETYISAAFYYNECIKLSEYKTIEQINENQGLL